MAKFKGRQSLTLYHTIPLFTTPKKKPFKEIVGNGENAGNQHFLLFPQCFLSYQTQKPSFEQHFLSSANAFNLVTSKILLLGKELNQKEPTLQICQAQLHYVTFVPGMYKCSKESQRKLLEEFVTLHYLNLIHAYNMRVMTALNCSAFSQSVFKRLVSQGHQKVSLCGNGL